MPKQGEIDYLKNIGAAALEHAVGKPYSDPNCAGYLMELAAILWLLPEPPARVLDLGCGTGWTSRFFAKRGYDVVGVDIATDMIEQAEQISAAESCENLRFVVSDYEQMEFVEEFDAAVFYDSLHHSMDEGLTLRMVAKALKPGGICITSEPGKGHAEAEVSRSAVEAYGVTERDMPPGTIVAAGREAGFREFAVYPRALLVGHCIYNKAGTVFRRQGLLQRLKMAARMVHQTLFHLNNSGIVVMRK